MRTADDSGDLAEGDGEDASVGKDAAADSLARARAVARGKGLRPGVTHRHLELLAFQIGRNDLCQCGLVVDHQGAVAGAGGLRLGAVHHSIVPCRPRHIRGWRNLHRTTRKPSPGGRG